MQITSSNLEKLMAPLTNLDMMISNNVGHNTGGKIEDNTDHFSLLSWLFRNHLDPLLDDKVIDNAYIESVALFCSH